MSQQNPNNLNYQLYHPDAVEDVDLAHEMALAGDERHTDARMFRQGAELAATASRAAAAEVGQAGAAKVTEHINRLSRDRDQGYLGGDVDAAHNISRGDADDLLTEEGRQEVIAKHQRVSELVDGQAEKHEELARLRYLSSE